MPNHDPAQPKTLQLTLKQERRFATEPPRMTILSDHPILRDDEDPAKRERDAFGLASRLAAVYDILRHKNTQTPIAIAIYGDWGTGKSSAMRWLSSQLAIWNKVKDRKGHTKLRTVWFDPWKFHDRQDVWRGLIAEVILNTIDVKGASLATVTNATKQFGLFLGRSFLNVLSGVKLKAGAECLGGEAEVNLDMLKKIAEDYHQTAHPEKAFLNDFEATLKEWVRCSLKDDERMVIFIDDLDRCLPEVAFEVLEALKLYLNIDKLIFVIGLDRRVIQSHVEKHYEDRGIGRSKARHYLAKMFQVEINIPPSQTQIEGYLTRQIEALDRVCDDYWSKNLTGWIPECKEIIENTVRRLAEHNPREIKRLLNSTLFRATAAARDDSLGNSESQRFTQGAQVFLVQEVLRGYFEEDDLLRYVKAQQFFARWSQLVALHPGERYPAGQSLERLVDRQPRSTDEPSEPTEAEKEYSQLFADDPRSGKDLYPLYHNDDLWALMEIPFSQDVAAATSVLRANNDTQEQPPDHVPAVLPPVVLGAIAKSLKRPIDQIAPEDILAVTELNLIGTQVSDVTPLAELKHLQLLYLCGTQVSDVTSLAKLKNLQELNLWGTQVSNVTPLAELKNLQELDLRKTQVSDVTPLAKLKNLQKLYLGGTQVSDVTPLAGLKNLQTLDLIATQVSDVTPLAALKNLQTLDLQGTQVSRDQVEQLRRLLPNLKTVEIEPSSEE